MKNNIDTATVKVKEVFNKHFMSYPSDKKSNTFQSFYLKDGSVAFIGAGACHIPLKRGNSYAKVGSVEYVVNRLQNSNSTVYKDQDACNAFFLEWLMNHSVWRNTYASNDHAKAIKDGMVFSNPETPNNLLVTGAIALRSTWEYPIRAKLFTDLVKEGVCPEVAMLATVRVGSFGHNNGNKGRVISYPVVDHTAIPGIAGLGVISNIIKRTPVKLGKPYGSVMTYSNLMGMWGGSPEMYSDRDAVVAMLKGPLTPTKCKIESINPFNKSNASPVGAVYEDFIEKASKALKDGYKYLATGGVA